MGAAELFCAQAREESRTAEIKQIVFFISASRKGRDPAVFGALRNRKVGFENQSGRVKYVCVCVLTRSNGIIRAKVVSPAKQICGYSAFSKRSVELAET